MKVLWITHFMFPEVTAKLTGNSEYKGSGGWLLGAAATLVDSGEINLYIASVSSIVDKITYIKGEKNDYILLPAGKGVTKENKELEPLWVQVNEHIKPDIVHIHGTEYSYGLAYINACGNENVVVSIQGVMSAVAQAYCGGMTKCEIIRNITIHDFRDGGILKGLRIAKIRAANELKIMSQIKYAIGRTDFDRQFVSSVNHDIEYFHNEESMRETFYTGCWSYDNCMPHTIFFSQAYYPLKGFHKLLQALPAILQVYPDTKVIVAGDDGRRISKIRQMLAINGYQNFIYRLIRRLNLEGCVTFTGRLSGDEIKKEMLKANVFVCSSSNENSSNSLCEAQLLGVPCIASEVGGITTLIPNDSCGLMYPFDDIEQLSKTIIEVFDSSSSFDNTKMRTIAKKRNDRNNNADTLIRIYNEILSNV